MPLGAFDSVPNITPTIIATGLEAEKTVYSNRVQDGL